jgi:hypothetical protein
VLEEAKVGERKSFLRSFVKKIVVENEWTTIYYILLGLQDTPSGRKRQFYLL